MQPLDVQPRLYERNGRGTRLYERMSDTELVRKAKNGDDRALDVLVTRHAPRERSVAIVESVLAWAHRTLVAHHLSPAAVPDALRSLGLSLQGKRARIRLVK